jgi:hypothetical protein
MAKLRGCFPKLLLLIVIIGAAAAAVPLLPISPLKDAVELKLSDTLGRKVSIESVRLSVITGPYLTLTGMTAQEDPEFGQSVFLKASEVRARLDLVKSLRTRQIVLDTITLKSPQIDLVKNPNGVWSWTTLGKRRSEQAIVSRLVSEAVTALSILSFPPEGSLSTQAFRGIKIDGASVKLRDHSGAKPLEVLYKNISLNASLTQNADEVSGASSQARGELVLQSEEDGEADTFKATLPFDLKIYGRGASALSVSGSIGPGPIETKNVRIGAIAVNGEISSNRDTPLTGKGHMSITDLVIPTVNLSERVAYALKLDQIGDMSPGTAVASLDTDFQISNGTVNTPGLRMQQVDGLGDATVETGSFKIESALTVNYAATIILSPEATSRVKSMSSAVGMLVTIFETNNQLSVPINITGDLRNPDVQVDVSRIF